MDYHGKHGFPFQSDGSAFLAPESSPLTMIRSHIFAIVFCYVVGVFGLRVFYIAPVLVLFWNHWRECYDAYVWITRLQMESLEIKKAAFKHGETVEWLNQTVQQWWSACDKSITNFVQDWMEPIACKFKLDHVVEYLKILSFNTGPYTSKFSNLRILQKVTKPKSSTDDVNVFIPITLDNLLHPPILSATEGRCTYAIEVDADLHVPSTDFKMQAKLGGIKQKLLMNIDSFFLSGRVQLVLNVDRRAVFPHLSSADVCFLPTPKLKVNCRLLKDKVDISSTPILKQIGDKYIEREFQRILVYPKKEHIDFTPTPPAGNEWNSLRDNGLSQGVLTVIIQPFSSDHDSIKKSILGVHHMKLTLGSQKCLSQVLSSDWSTTFSFLVHDCGSEKLIAKLKSKRKHRQGNVVNKMEISLASLGIGVDETESTDKKVQMSAGGVHFLFSLNYTTLAPLSLIYPIPSLNGCSMEDSGVLYVHVHGCQGVASPAAKSECPPYCVVRQGSEVILQTHSLSSSGQVPSLLSWERGVEILVRSCRGIELTFEVLGDRGIIGSHESLGWTSLRIPMGQPQLIQNRLPLSSPLRKFPRPHPSTPPPSIYVSTIYRNVKSVNLTRDSLQESFLQRTRHDSIASCLDLSTKFLNPLSQGYEVTNAQLSSDDDSVNEDYNTFGNGRGDHTPNDYGNRVVSDPEESLIVARN